MTDSVSLASRIAARLRRTTASGDFIPEVDGLRAIAIAAVVAHHVTASYLVTTERFGRVDLPGQWWNVFPRSLAIAAGYTGHFGVPLFFVLSGFVLALPFVRSYRDGAPRPRLASYYLRRIVRLEAPYAANIGVAFVVIVLTNVGWREFVPHLLPTLLYVHGPVFGQASWLNGVAWSLEVEIQFYVLVPLLAAVFAVRSTTARRGLLTAATLGTAYAAATLIHANESPRLQMTLLNYLQFFIAGFLLADIYHARTTKEVGRGWAGDVVAAAAGWSLWTVLTHRYGYYFLTPLLVALFYAGLFTGRIGHRVITQRWVVVIGGMCYTIYLYHFLVIGVIAPHIVRFTSLARRTSLDLLLYGLVLVVPVAIVSVVMFVAVEKPFMNLSRRVGRRFREAGRVSA